VRPIAILSTGFLTLILAIATACGDDEALAPTDTPAPTETPATSATPTPTPDPQISFETLIIGHNSGLTGEVPTVLKIDNQSAWTDLWDIHQGIVSPTNAPPSVDFDSQIIIAVFDKEQASGGFSIEIQTIEIDASGLVVEVVRTAPGPGCIVTQALTQPFHIVVADAVAGEPRLALTDDVTDCSEGVSSPSIASD
jgi:hypothetical protein